MTIKIIYSIIVISIYTLKKNKGDKYMNLDLNNKLYEIDEEDIELYLDEDPFYYEEDDDTSIPYESAMEP